MPESKHPYADGSAELLKGVFMRELPGATAAKRNGVWVLRLRGLIRKRISPLRSG